MKEISESVSKNRVVISSLAVLAFAALFVSASVMPVSAASLRILIKPDKGVVNRSITLSGGGFLDNATITIKFDSTTIATTTSNSTGGFSTTFKVPDAVAGAHTVTVSDGTNTISKSFTVTTNLALKPKSGAAGSSVTVTGTGFAATSTVKLTFNGVAIGKAMKTNSTGGFTETITIPNDAAGSYPVVGTDASGNTHTATFTIS